MVLLSQQVLMETIALGKSDLKSSQIGIGVWQASNDWHGDDEQVIKAVGTAGELGVNLVDTAEGYGSGRSEQVLGRALGIYGREKFLIATKVMAAHLRYEELQKACAGSLRRLGINQIDLYQVHWPDPWEQIPLKETFRALEKLYLEGKIRTIGVSNFAVRDLEEARSYLSHTDIVSNQLRYNILQRNIEEEVLPYCKREGIAILAWSPIAQGALSGKYTSKNMPSGDVRVENVLFNQENMLQVEKVTAVLSKIAKSHMCTVTQVALNWLTSNSIVIPIPGVKNPAQTREDIMSQDFKLTSQEIGEINQVSAETKINYYPEEVKKEVAA
jgi:myo-inositol catabolism protein IolS